MIFTIAIVVVTSFVRFLSLLLPDAGSMSQQTIDSITSIGTYFHMLDMIFPIASLFAALTIVVAFEITLAGLNIARWLIRATPFINSRI
jgi:hypothetical protein